MRLRRTHRGPPAPRSRRCLLLAAAATPDGEWDDEAVSLFEQVSQELTAHMAAEGRPEAAIQQELEMLRFFVTVDQAARREKAARQAVATAFSATDATAAEAAAAAAAATAPHSDWDEHARRLFEQASQGFAARKAEEGMPEWAIQLGLDTLRLLVTAEPRRRLAQDGHAGGPAGAPASPSSLPGRCSAADNNNASA